MKKETSDGVSGLIAFCVVVALFVWFVPDGCSEPGWFEPDETMAERIFGKENAYDIEKAEDCVKKYYIAGRSGYHDDAEDEARMAASYYLDAGDEANYRKWKELEKIVEEYNNNSK